MKRMLINATQPEECRVAMVDGQFLYDLDIEVAAKGQRKASIYKARVVRVEPSLEAAFVDYGAERHGFLPFKEVAHEYRAGRKNAAGQPVAVRDILVEGLELLVQVEKEERGRKGAALTTFPSLAGRYLVLMPNNPRAGGISRRVEGDERSDLREVLSALDIPAGMGLIVRTAGVGKSQEELQRDLDYLLRLWRAIDAAAKERPSPFLVYQESNIIIRTIRDYFSRDIGQILIDNPKVHQEALEFINQVMPESASKVVHYTDRVPLFSRYQIESQIESAFSHSVSLPSGGSIVIDHTEALISIDVNSARSTRGGDIEETALSTNLEAADEIARQLRLRDAGGLIVIDFIDMTPTRNQREVENRLRDALKEDRARIQVGRISRFGLLEMSRQRLRPSLGESSQHTCPTCNGQGTVRGPESLSLSVLRLLDEEAMKEMTDRVIARLPIEVASFLLNEKREGIFEIEKRNGVRIVLVPDPQMILPNYEVERVREDNRQHEVHHQSSYELITPPDAAAGIDPRTQAPRAPVADEPAVKMAQTLAPPASPPQASTKTDSGDGNKAERRKKPGLFSRILRGLFSPAEEDPKPEEKAQDRSPEKKPRRHRSSHRGEGSRRGPERGRGRGQKAAGDSGGENDRKRRSDEDSSASSSNLEEARRRREPANRSSSGRRSGNANSSPTVHSREEARPLRNRAADPSGESAAAPESQDREPSGEGLDRPRRTRRGRRGGSRRREGRRPDTSVVDNENSVDPRAAPAQGASQSTPAARHPGSNAAAPTDPAFTPPSFDPPPAARPAGPIDHAARPSFPQAPDRPSPPRPGQWSQGESGASSPRPAEPERQGTAKPYPPTPAGANPSPAPTRAFEEPQPKSAYPAQPAPTPRAAHWRSEPGSRRFSPSPPWSGSAAPRPDPQKSPQRSPQRNPRQDTDAPSSEGSGLGGSASSPASPRTSPFAERGTRSDGFGTPSPTTRRAPSSPSPTSDPFREPKNPDRIQAPFGEKRADPHITASPLPAAPTREREAPLSPSTHGNHGGIPGGTHGGSSFSSGGGSPSFESGMPGIARESTNSGHRTPSASDKGKGQPPYRPPYEARPASPASPEASDDRTATDRDRPSKPGPDSKNSASEGSTDRHDPYRDPNRGPSRDPHREE